MFYTTKNLDKKIVLKITGSESDERVWCVAVLKNDKTHRIRDYDGFYEITELKQIKP